MFIIDLFEEAQERRLVVIYPGRFQPFHLGHKEVFSTLQSKFGRNNVFIATSNKVSLPKSPFSFSDKLVLINSAGITNNFIVETAEPYKINSYIQTLNLELTNTVVIFAVGAPDLERLEVDARYTELTPTGRPSKIPQGKAVGDEKPLKTFKSFAECMTADQHQYVVVVSEREKSITIDGKKYDVSHGTECRELWNQVRNDPENVKQYLMGLYGRATPELVQIFNKIPDTSAAPETPVADIRAPKQPKPVKAAGLKEDTNTPQGQAAAQALKAGIMKHKEMYPNLDPTFGVVDRIDHIQPDGTFVMQNSTDKLPMGNLKKLLALGGGANFNVTMSPAAPNPNVVSEEAAGVGVVKSTSDPRYMTATMGDDNDVDGSTLGKMMKAYSLVGVPAPKTRQQAVNKNVGKGINEGLSDTWLTKSKDTGEIAIIPPGGMGSYSPDTLLSSLLRNLNDMVQRVEAGNATGAEYELYKGGVIKGKIAALARYQEFLEKQGRRPIAKGAQIKIGENK